MKLVKTKYESLDYQKQAIKSIVDLFQGIETKISPFQIKTTQLYLNASPYGESNCIVTKNWIDVVNENLKTITKNNGLDFQPISNVEPTFDVEMETGTGKTYVFLRTIFELNKQYNFNKFIIVVPSIAIREGILKTIDDIKEHFNLLYNNPNFHHFVYNPDNINDVNLFATSNNIEIMIINIQSFNSNNKIFNQYNERLVGQKPIDLIKQTNPIIIIDEPQTTASTQKSNNAINELNPLFKIRYSATFRIRKNECLVYRLNSIDAYEQNLVKKITVSTPNEEGSKYIKGDIVLKGFDKKGLPTLTLKILNPKTGKISSKTKTLQINDDIYKVTNNEKHKRGYVITSCNYEQGHIELDGGDIIKLNESNDESKDLEYKKIQIRTTIKFHLDRQLELKKHGIKVLSLFFIDEVSKYREYKNNESAKGVYAQYFEEEFIKLASQSEYKDLFGNANVKEVAETIHNGYFSMDNKKKMSNTSGDSSRDDDTYKLIMKDKDKLLSFDSPLAFIFSHSALKEGWDNPNVFQICVLNKGNSEFKKRQEIGRGLRLCLDQNGNRIHNSNINVLTVITDETIKEFVSKLQKEMKEDLGISFTTIDLLWLQKNCNLNIEQSTNLLAFLKEHHYIHDDGEIVMDLMNDEGLQELTHLLLANKTNLLIDDKKVYTIAEQLNKRANGYIQDANKIKKNKYKKEVIESKEFTNLWNCIAQKTYYEVQINSNKLLDVLIEPILKKIETIPAPWFEIQNTELKIDSNGIQEIVKNRSIETITIDNPQISVAQFINQIALRTNITKNTIAQLCNRLNEKQVLIKALKRNQEKVINEISQMINNQKDKLMIETIQYFLINDSYSINQLLDDTELHFTANDITTYKLTTNDKYPYEWLVCDSKVEVKFAEFFLAQEQLNKFIKLPSWFKINTPIGTYNPDWAIYENHDLKLVIETKGNIEENQLRDSEKNKIACAKKHFDVIKKNVVFQEVDNTEEVCQILVKYNK